MAPKRTRDDTMGENKAMKTEQGTASPFMSMFEGFRAELDEHHDRRERVIKASRDITAASKKIIFTLQRVRSLGRSVPAFVNKNNAQYWETIQERYRSISADVQGLNACRYEGNISGGNQEFIESLSFQHYLEDQTLISYDEAQARIAKMSSSDAATTVTLTPEDYVLGIFDMVGELMRYSITSMATLGKLPTGPNKKDRSKYSNNHQSQQAAEADNDDVKMDLDNYEESDSELQEHPRTVLADLRELRLQLEMFEPPSGTWFGREVDKKMVVMRECVDKVEKALYGLTVRGSERPKGWLPDVRAAAEVESY